MPQSWPFLARPPIQSRSVSGLRYPLENAGVAQLAEQLFCKQQVTGSIPVAGSNRRRRQRRILGRRRPNLLWRRTEQLGHRARVVPRGQSTERKHRTVCEHDGLDPSSLN